MDTFGKTGIKSVVIEEIRDLARKYGIEQVILFGSRARSDYSRASDIDLAVRGGNVMQFELGWKVLKELLRYEGRREAVTGSPREIIKTAYAVYDFVEEEAWLSMLRDRNDMTHIYDGKAAYKLAEKILDEYIPVFLKLKKDIEGRYQDVLDSI